MTFFRHDLEAKRAEEERAREVSWQIVACVKISEEQNDPHQSTSNHINHILMNLGNKHNNV